MTCTCTLCAANRATWDQIAADIAAGITHPCTHGHTGYCQACDAALDIEGEPTPQPTPAEENDMDRAYENQMRRVGLW